MRNERTHCRPRHRVGVALTILLAGLSMTAWAAEQAGPEELLEVNAVVNERRIPLDALEKELDTMTKVIERSLDQSGAGDWHSIPTGLSSFDRVVRAQYIPTVGALFTVPVSFPIVAPKEVEKERAEPGEPGDLWDELSKEPSPRIPDVERRKHPEGRRETLYGRGDRLVVLSDAPYDEARVVKLRKALASVLVRYGHRLEHVQPTERVLIVVEAPQPQQTPPEGTDPFMALFEEAQDMVRVFGVPHVSRLTRQDHLLFSVVKAGLTDGEAGATSRVNVLSY